jgi:hypothetical protein
VIGAAAQGVWAGAAALRRMLRPATMLLALLAGTGAGLIVRGLPEGDLAGMVYPPLVATLVGVLTLPLAAGLATSERHGGFEQLVAVRPIGSLPWTLGRVSGSLVGAALLALLLAASARTVGGTVRVPETVEGSNVRSTSALPVWRFALPAGRTGPFELRLAGVGPRILRHELGVEVARGGAREVQPSRVVSGRSIRFDVPDLAPARGDLFVSLRPGPGLLLDDAAPHLVIGQETLGRAGLPLPLGAVRRLAFAVLAVVAAACAFRFETACLAGVLALAVNLPWAGPRFPAAAAGLLVVALLGTALTRRAALP